MPELELGLGLWQGEYQGIERLWLRWYDAQSNWILTQMEQERQRAEQERAQKAQALQQAEQALQRAEQAEARLESLIQRLRESGIDPETFLNDQS
jgi:CCR4-NOT transcriptional regulation complex NOT5 subunit